ncbi:MAG TPA: murein biosynthesis integral membrane protein MurJ [Longimicrobiales bacterium]|nr:murein biosynthesis integral membrane protein MurJ [Longimicrobiales bacterium]
MTQPTDPVSPLGEAAEPTTPAGNVLSSAQLVAAGILLSRIAGFARDVVFANYFGTSQYASAFRGALRMPNVLQNLLGEGTLSASFIPVYSQLIERGDREAAGRLAGTVFSLLLAIAGGLALFGVLLAPVLVSVFLPGFSDKPELHELTITCARIIFPMTGLLVLSAWALGVLNSHRQFFVSYTAPVLWNAAMIAVLVLFGSRLDQRNLVIALAWGALLGGALQFLVQLPWVFRLERSLRPGWNLQSPHVRTVLRNATPAIMGRGVVQLSGWVDMALASFLFTGAVGAIGYAQTLYMLPVSLFGMSIAAAELPEMSRTSSDDTEPLRRRIAAALRQMAVFVVPAVAGYLVLGDIIVGAMYERGDFVRGDTVLVYLILAGYSMGLLASTASRLYSSSFYALHDTRTPARIAFLRVIVSAVCGGLLMVALEPVRIFGTTIGFGDGVILGGRPIGAAGLAAGTALGAWLEWTLLRRALARRIGAPAAGSVLLRLGLAALLAAALARALLSVLPPMPVIAAAAGALGVFASAYFALAHLFRVEEVRAALRRITRRLRPRP